LFPLDPPPLLPIPDTATPPGNVTVVVLPPAPPPEPPPPPPPPEELAPLADELDVATNAPKDELAPGFPVIADEVIFTAAPPAPTVTVVEPEIDCEVKYLTAPPPPPPPKPAPPLPPPETTNTSAVRDCAETTRVIENKRQRINRNLLMLGIFIIISKTNTRKLFYQ
jgi:hypothetical protein